MTSFEGSITLHQSLDGGWARLFRALLRAISPGRQRALLAIGPVGLGPLDNAARLRVRGDLRGALAHYEAATNSHHQQVRNHAWLGVGGIRRTLGDIDGAISAYEAVTHGGDKASGACAMVALGQLRLGLGDVTGAQRAFSGALASGYPAVSRYVTEVTASATVSGATPRGNV